jgi:predicted O-methyltransferase YrrM
MIDTHKYISQKYTFDGDKYPIRLGINRKELANLFKELGFKTGAEIGVDKGYFSLDMCMANPGVKLYCIDPWKVYSAYPDMKEQHYLDVNYKITTRRLAPYNCQIIKRSSMGVVKDFEDNSLDFVYIDGNHEHDYVLEDIREWSRKVRTGGIVSGHDYNWKSHGKRRADVSNAVDGYCKDNGIKNLFLANGNGGSSWFYIKEDNEY